MGQTKEQRDARFEKDFAKAVTAYEAALEAAGDTPIRLETMFISGIALILDDKDVTNAQFRKRVREGYKFYQECNK